MKPSIQTHSLLRSMTGFNFRNIISLKHSGLLACIFVLFLSTKAVAQSWSETDPLSFERYEHSSTLLPNGMVLVTGGYFINSDYTSNYTLSSCELFNDSSKTWSATGSMSKARMYHSAILLKNGKVLVAGGGNDNGFLSDCEIYDPSTGTWSSTGSLNKVRFYHTATLLPNGKVLITGGMDENYNSISSCEIYDPSNGTWSTTGSLNTDRYAHTASLNGNGKVMVSGGETLDPNTYYYPKVKSTEIFDDSAGTWSYGADMPDVRSFHSANTLNNGDVLIIGGTDENNYVKSCFLYHTAKDSWSTTGNLNYYRYGHTSDLLLNGRVLVAGGSYEEGEAELYDVSSGVWSLAGNLNYSRNYHRSSVLKNGNVLISGGSFVNVIKECEIFEIGNCLPPSVPTISASSINNCGTQNTTLSIASGNLDSATAWYWYTGSCGGSAIDSGASITVSPSETTTYFVRGEGGCVTPGNCASVTINVNEKPACNITGFDIVCPASTSNEYRGTKFMESYRWSVSGSGTLASDTIYPYVAITAGADNQSTFTVKLSVKGDNDCVSECEKTVQVLDVTPPVWVKAPSNKTVECDGSGNTQALNAWLQSFSGTDLCGNATVTNNFSGFSDDCGMTGSATVTFTLTDAYNNSISNDATFTIEDNTPPVITCPSSAAINFGDDASVSTLGSATAVDACGDVVITHVDQSNQSSDPDNDGYKNYSITRTWKATDACGNYSTCNQFINVVDGTQPTVYFGSDSSFNSPTSYPAPYNSFYESAKHQIIILASELEVAGVTSEDTIKSLAFNVKMPDDSSLVQNGFTVRIGHTDSSNVDVGQFFSGLTQVYQSNFKCGYGWNNHAFDAPFFWDGHSNLVIETCFSNGNYINNNPSMYYSKTSFNSVLEYHVDGQSACNQSSGNKSKNRPNIRLSIGKVEHDSIQALCKRSVTLSLGSNGSASLTASDIDSGSYSGAGIKSLEINTGTFTCKNIGLNTAILTVTDNNNSTAQCSTEVNVVGTSNSCSIEVKPTSKTYTGGDPKTIYLGYGSQSAVLKGSATGGTGLTYSWSPSSNLSCAKTQNTEFSPTESGNYTYTLTVLNNNGCSTTCNVTLCVKDIRVKSKGGCKDNDKKVYLCHVPPGNPNNPQTLSISVNAVKAHLTNHDDDALGKCGTTCGSSKNNDEDLYELVLDMEDLEITCSPNPFTSSIKLNYFSAFDTESTIYVYDMKGVEMEKIRISGYENQVELGKNLAAGIYTIAFLQENVYKTFKVIKID